MTKYHWLETGLSPQQLRYVGTVTIVWNAIEYSMQELIMTAAGWHPSLGMLVTADMGNIARYQLAKNLINGFYEQPRLRAEALNAIAFFDVCRSRRNALVHGMPVLDDEKRLSGRLGKFEGKKGTGSISISHLNVTDHHLFLNSFLIPCCANRRSLTQKKDQRGSVNIWHRTKP